MQKLAAKLVSVMKEVSYVEKKGTNEYHRYSYATSADVLQKINAALTKYNICSVTLPEIIRCSEVVTNKGNTEHLVTVKLDVMLTDADSGEVVTITGLGSGQDSGDKAVMKAQTAALKYAYLLSMAISTGDDPEADSKTDEAMICSDGKQGGLQLGDKTKEPICSECGVSISAKVKSYSKGKYDKPLCMKCQQQHNVA